MRKAPASGGGGVPLSLGIGRPGIVSGPVATVETSESRAQGRALKAVRDEEDALMLRIANEKRSGGRPSKADGDRLADLARKRREVGWAPSGVRSVN